MFFCWKYFAADNCKLMFFPLFHYTGITLFIRPHFVSRFYKLITLVSINQSINQPINSAFAIYQMRKQKQKNKKIKLQ